MREQTRHPSRLRLDLHLAGVGPELLAEHVEGCTGCQRRLERMEADRAEFLERFPTLESLERPGRAGSDVPEPADPAQAPGRRYRTWISAAAATAAVAAALVIGLLWTLPGADSLLPLRPADGERVKGGSVVEIAVKRDGASTSYEGQSLRAGDVLAFRVTTDRRYLLLLSVEQTGRINVFLTDPQGKQSMAITPGTRTVLPRGVELDDYVGPERLVALLTDRPLPVTGVRRELERAYRALPASRRRTLDLRLPSYNGETLTWLLTKVAP